MKVKVCGMREWSNIQQVADAGVDFMGFIFYKDSPRCVGEDFRLPQLSSSIMKVGVFVNETAEKMKSSAKTFGLDFIQLHGTESPATCEELKLNGLSLIKAFSIDEKFDFNEVDKYSPFVDFFLFDTKGRNFGGNAVTFDWKLLRRYNQSKPFFLSGGLHESNLSEIAEFKDLNIYAIDLNSGVEITPGLKDVWKINRIKNLINVSI